MNVNLLLGDCIDVLPRLRGGYSFVLTDPPYSRAGGAHTSRGSTARTAVHSAGVASDAFWSHWFRDVWGAVAKQCRPDACGMIFTDYRTIGALERAVSSSGTGWNVSQCAMWDRSSMGLGSPMRAGYEMIAFVRGPDFKWAGRKDITNVFRCRWNYGAHEHHPSEKPVDLLREIVRDFAFGGPVLDPFCGSGSTLVACRAEGVDSTGIECDVDTAIVASRRLGIRSTPFCNTVLRRDERGRVWMMNRPDRGWGEFAVPFESEDDVRVRYAVLIGEWTEDEHGPMAPVTVEAA